MEIDKTSTKAETKREAVRDPEPGTALEQATIGLGANLSDPRRAEQSAAGGGAMRTVIASAMREALIEQIRENPETAIQAAAAMHIRMGRGAQGMADSMELIGLIKRNPDAAIDLLERQNRAEVKGAIQIAASGARDDLVTKIRENPQAALETLEQLSAAEAHVLLGSKGKRDELMELVRRNPEAAIGQLEKMNRENPPRVNGRDLAGPIRDNLIETIGSDPQAAIQMVREANPSSLIAVFGSRDAGERLMEQIRADPDAAIRMLRESAIEGIPRGGGRLESAARASLVERITSSPDEAVRLLSGMSRQEATVLLGSHAAASALIDMIRDDPESAAWALLGHAR